MPVDHHRFRLFVGMMTSACHEGHTSDRDARSKLCSLQEEDASNAILCQLVTLAASNQPLLMLVDNAEDPLRAEQEVRQAFKALLTQVR